MRQPEIRNYARQPEVSERRVFLVPVEIRSAGKMESVRSHQALKHTNLNRRGKVMINLDAGNTLAEELLHGSFRLRLHHDAHRNEWMGDDKIRDGTLQFTQKPLDTHAAARDSTQFSRSLVS